MREILFRGFSTDSGEWVEGWFAMYPFARWPLKEAIIPAQKAKDGHFYHVEVIPETVGQFTGLTDKNGTKIFEGDILLAKVYETAIEDSEVWGKQKIRTGNKIDAVWTVEHKIFNANCGYFIYGKDRRFNRLLTYSVIFNNECEVIGNIHDNPELLEVE